eukprot:gene8099-16617_t
MKSSLRGIRELVDHTRMSALQTFVLHPAFEVFIYSVIFLNCLFLAVASTTKANSRYITVGYWIFNVVYIFEMVLRVAARNIYMYFKDSWNWIDAVVVAFSVYQIIIKILAILGLTALSPSVFETLAALRLIRFVRILFLSPHTKTPQRLVTVFVKSSLDLLCAASLIFITLIAWAFIAHEVLGDKLNYRCIPNTLSTLEDVSAYYYNVYGTTDFRPIYNENICGYGPHTCDTVIINNVSSVCTDLSAIFTSSSTPSYWSYSTPYSAFVTTFILLTMRGWMDLFWLLVDAQGVVVASIFVVGPPLLFYVLLLHFFPAILFMSLKVGEDRLRKKEWLAALAGSNENVTEFQLIILAFSNMLTLKTQQIKEAKSNGGTTLPPIPSHVKCVPRCRPCGTFREIIFAENGYYNYMVSVLIVLDVVMMASISADMSTKYRLVVEAFNIATVSFFLGEIVLKLCLLGPYEYFSRWKQIGEFTVTVVSILGLLSSDYHFLFCARLFRLVYLIRNSKFVPVTKSSQTAIGVHTFKKIVQKMAPSMFIFVFLFVLMQVLFALVGVHFFGETYIDIPTQTQTQTTRPMYSASMESSDLKLDRIRFGSFEEAMVSLFLIFTLDIWYTSLWAAMESTGRFSSIFFILWIGISNWILQAFMLASTMLIMDGEANDFIIRAAAAFEMTTKKLPVLKRRLILRDYFLRFRRHTFDPKLLRLKGGGGGNGGMEVNNEVKEALEAPPTPHWIVRTLGDMQHYPLCVVPPGSPFHKFCLWLAGNRKYVIFIICIVILSVTFTILEGLSISTSRSNAVTIDVILTVLFLFDMGLKWCGVGWFLYPRGYFFSFFNWIDFVCNVLIIQAWMYNSKMYNSIRILRIFRMQGLLYVFGNTPGVAVLLNAISRSLRSFYTLFLTTCLILFVFATVGLEIFMGTFGHCSDSEYPSRRDRYFSDTAYPDGCSGSAPDPHWEQPRERFDNIGKAFQSVFRVMMFNEWHPILFSAMDSVGADKQPERFYSSGYILYFTLIVLTSVVLNSLVVGVVYYHFKLSTLWGGKTIIRSVKEAMWTLYEEQLHSIHLVDRGNLERKLGGFQKVYKRWMNSALYKTLWLFISLLPPVLWHVSTDGAYLAKTGFAIGTVTLNCVYLFDYCCRWTIRVDDRYRWKLKYLELSCAICLTVITLVLIGNGFDPSVKSTQLAEGCLLLRLSRYLGTFKVFNHMIETMARAFFGVLPLLALSLLIVITYVITGKELLSSTFPDLVSCWAALMRVATGNGWSEYLAVYSRRESYSVQIFSYIYFLSFYLIFNLLLKIFAIIIIYKYYMQSGIASSLAKQQIKEFQTHWARQHEHNDPKVISFHNFLGLLHVLDYPLGFGGRPVSYLDLTRFARRILLSMPPPPRRGKKMTPKLTFGTLPVLIAVHKRAIVRCPLPDEKEVEAFRRVARRRLALLRLCLRRVDTTVYNISFCDRVELVADLLQDQIRSLITRSHATGFSAFEAFVLKGLRKTLKHAQIASGRAKLLAEKISAFRVDENSIEKAHRCSFHHAK